MSTPQPAAREHDPFRATRWSPRVRWRLAPWWAKVVAVYLGARLITTTIVLRARRASRARTRGPARSPGTSSTRTSGMRGGTRSSGSADTRATCRSPTRARSARTRGRSCPSSRRSRACSPGSGCRGTRHPSSIAVLAGLGAALVLHRLMSRFLEPDRALFAVVLFCGRSGVADHAVRLRRVARLPVARARAAAARRPKVRMARARARRVGVHPSRGAGLRPHARAALDLAVVAAGARSVPDARTGGRGIRRRLRGRRGVRVAGHRVGRDGELDGYIGDRARVAVGVHRAIRSSCRSPPGSKAPTWWLVGAAARGARHRGRRGARRELRG